MRLDDIPSECRITKRRITERRITERRITERRITERWITERRKLPNVEYYPTSNITQRRIIPVSLTGMRVGMRPN